MDPPSDRDCERRGDDLELLRRNDQTASADSLPLHVPTAPVAASPRNQPTESVVTEVVLEDSILVAPESQAPPPASTQQQQQQQWNTSNYVTATIYKPTAETKVGINLQQHAHAIVVSGVEALLANTRLELGHQILSINNRIPQNHKEAGVLLRNAHGFVTILAYRSLEEQTDCPYTAAIYKPDRDMSCGIGFYDDEGRSAVFIGTLAADSLFVESGLARGDPLLLVENFTPSTAMEAATMISKSCGIITILVGQSLTTKTDSLTTTMNVNSIEGLLQSLDLGRHSDSFRDNGITKIEDAELLSKQDIVDLGVDRIGERNRLLKWVAETAAAKRQRSTEHLSQPSPSPHLAKTAPSPKVYLIGVSPVEIALQRSKDRTPVRLSLADQVGTQIYYALCSAYSIPVEKATHVLKVQLSVVSEGSRSGRLLAAEFGSGHSKLSLNWSLEMKHTKQLVIPWQPIHKKMSGGLGFKDFVAADVGETDLGRMAVAASSEIIMSVSRSIGTSQPASGGGVANRPSATDQIATAFAVGAARRVGSELASGLLFS